MNSRGLGLQGMTSIFSRPSSALTAWMRCPLWPMQAPIGSTLGLWLTTATLLRLPGARATFVIYTRGIDGRVGGAQETTPREHLAVVAWQGRIYAIGGRAAGKNVAAVEAYDPAEDRWVSLAPLPTARSGLAAAVVGDRVVVAGGEDPSLVRGKVFAEVEIYDPKADRWEVAPPMPTPRHGLGGAGYRGMALFVGGSGRQGALSPTAWSGVVEGFRLGTGG